jgi:hypothetical protein
MKIDILHIGFNKCGTTFIENEFYRQHNEIEFSHLVDDLNFEEKFRKDFILADRITFNRENFISYFNDGLESLYKESKKSKKVLMYDAFSFTYQKRFDRKTVLERIKKFFPEAKIVMMIRNQRSWLVSHYGQYVRAGGKINFYDFIESQLTNPYLDGDYIDWFPYIQTLHEIFGEENVHVILYEDINKSPQNVLDQLSLFSGISKFKKADTKKVNPSLSKTGLNIKRFLNILVPHQYGDSQYGYFNRYLFGAKPTKYGNTIWKLKYKVFKGASLQLVAMIDRVFGFKNKYVLSDEQKESIYQKYKESNLKLSKLLKRNLQSLDY